MAIKFIFSAAVGRLAEAFRKMKEPIAIAATAAIREMASSIKFEGRADIAAAGFSRRWQNTFRADTYPGGKRVSIDAASLVYHKIPYADVFETGADIRGKPTLWIPLSTAPKRIGRKKMTPKLFVQQIGPLFPLKRPGKATLLMANIARNKRGGIGKITNAKLRKGAAGAGATGAVPIFVGVDTVTLRKRFHLRAITDKNAARLPSLYYRFFRDA